MDFFGSGKVFFSRTWVGKWDSFLVTEERKKLHNLVLELKGNIRVFVRVSWFKYLEGYTSDGGSVVGGRCFLRCFFFAVSEEIHHPPFYFKGISKKIYEQCELVWLYIF